MMNSSGFELLAVALGAAVVLLMLFSQQRKMDWVAAAVLTVMLIGFAQPASAAAVNDNVLTKGQETLNEVLKTTPGGNQYQGIEYAETKGAPLSDREITKRVEKTIPEQLKLSVSNGSVRLSGTVYDRGTIQNIIEDVKAIPGVHEVSYDIGLENRTIDNRTN
jgi:uncharacterized membrane protein YhiD involved in acid resistance